MPHDLAVIALHRTINNIRNYTDKLALDIEEGEKTVKDAKERLANAYQEIEKLSSAITALGPISEEAKKTIREEAADHVIRAGR